MDNGQTTRKHITSAADSLVLAKIYYFKKSDEVTCQYFRSHLYLNTLIFLTSAFNSKVESTYKKDCDKNIT